MTQSPTHVGSTSRMLRGSGNSPSLALDPQGRINRGSTRRRSGVSGDRLIWQRMDAATPATPEPDDPSREGLRTQAMLDRITWFLVGLLVIAFAMSWIRLMGKPRGDYDIHWAFARKLLNHQPLYVREMDLFHPYPPFWAVFHVLVAFFPMQASQLVVYPLGVAVMIGVFVLLWRLVRPFVPASREARLAIVTLAAVLASRYLLRDLPEVAVNTLL